MNKFLYSKKLQAILVIFVTYIVIFSLIIFRITSADDDVTPPTFNFTTAEDGSINANSTFTFEFDVTDTETNISLMQYSINGGDRVTLEPLDEEYDDLIESFSITFNTVNFANGPLYVIDFYAYDAANNEATEHFEFTIQADTNGPTIEFEDAPEGLVPAGFTYRGTATDTQSNLWYLAISFDGGDPQTVFALDGSFDSLEEDFEYGVGGFSEGEHTITFFVGDISGNQTEYTFEVDVDRGIPTCTASWVNLPTPHYSNSATYSNIICTDNRIIDSARFDLYHTGFGVIYGPENIMPLDGVFDESTEEFTFSYELDPDQDLDGATLLTFRVWDEAGNQGFDRDPLVLEYFDDSPPIINLDKITPDPLTDTTPRVTGSCGDVTQMDTNTNISLIEYNIDNEGWNDVISLTPPYNDSVIETFSFELDELALGEHTVEIRCTDGANHTSTDSDTFEIISINEAEGPGQFSHNESFSNHDFQDLANTNLIWGNGKLRLREDIPTIRTNLDSTDFLPRYTDVYGVFDVQVDPQDRNILWYSKGNQIYKYNLTTNEVTQLDTQGLFNAAHFNQINSYLFSVYEGKTYLWVTDPYAVFVANLTDNIGYVNLGWGGIVGIVPDTDRGRLGIYMLTHPDTAPGGMTNIMYWDLNGTIEDDGDDIETFVPVDVIDGFEYNNAIRIHRQSGTNNMVISLYPDQVYKFNDNNTAHNTTDDQIIKYEGFPVPWAISTDPDGKILIGTANNGGGGIWVVSDDGGTEFDESDDTITQIANSQQLWFRSIYGITYLEGENGVGDQLFLTTEGADPIYMNFNDTYTDSYDDTFIDLNVSSGIRPGGASFSIYDYNTLYAVIANQGLIKVDLHRGWVDSGQAIGVPQRPSNKLILNNFVAGAEAQANIAAYIPPQNSFLEELDNFLFPKVYADAPGVRYYLSNDDGVTWTEVSLGQLKQLNPADYRVKFKIEMSKVSGSTPVLDSYVLDFAAYTTETQAQIVNNLTTSAASSVPINTNFNIIINAVDQLGFPVAGFNDDVVLSLVDLSNNVTTGLNKASVSLVDGNIVITDAQINKTGQYKIKAESGSLSAISNTINVTNVSESPSLIFYANTYKIKKGESVTLYWISERLDTLNLNPYGGNVATIGSLTLKLEEDTYFVLSGTGPYGSLQTGFNIVVEDSSSSANSSQNQGPLTGVGNETQTLTLKTSGDITVNPGDKVKITWSTTGADYVYIDYIGKEVSTSGEFEFYAENDTKIVVTARNDNGEEVEKTINIKVNKPLLVGNEISQNLAAVGLVALLGVNILLFASLLFNVVSSGPVRVTLDTIAGILRILGFIPYKKRQGYVYQTNTANPVPFAVLSLSAAENKDKILTSIVSDVNGVYYEPFLSKGNYFIVAKHEGHNFPTIEKRPVQLTSFDFYKGEELNIQTNKVQQAVIVPMDKQQENEYNSFNWYKVSLLLNRILVWLQWTVYPMFVLSVIYAISYPILFNIVVCAIYTLLIIVKILSKLKKPTLTGHVTDSRTNRGIEGAFVQLRLDGKLVALEKTNKTGQFKFYVPDDKYTIHVSHDKYTSAEGFGNISIVDLTLESPQVKELSLTRIN